MGLIIFFSNAFKRLRGLGNAASIVGLSVGISTSVMILLVVINQLSFDRFHTNSKRIFSIQALINFGGSEVTAKKMSAQFGPSLTEASSDVMDFLRLKQNKRVTISSDARNFFYEDRFIFADPSILSIFSFKL